MTAKALPVLYVSHGSPMLAVEPALAGKQMTIISEYLQTMPIECIVVVSAHWLTEQGIGITGSEEPEIIYDFYGFPQELYELSYPAKGSFKKASMVKDVLAEQGVQTRIDPERGLDHGAWVPLRYLFPKADIPVLQVSIPWPIKPEGAVKLGEALRALRNQGVLIVTSGSQTHNLRDVAYDRPPHAYIQPFVEWMRKTMQTRDLEALKNYRTLAPNAVRAHPIEDHFMPMLIALAASSEDDKVHLYDGGVDYSALSMDAYLFEPR
ncbi:MAG: DODA-type extradiol aromatic ring-opening family dioxygenase [Saezia sp.]